MNITKFFRLLNRSDKIFTIQGKYATSFDKIGSVGMATNVSAHQSKKELEEFQDVLPSIMDSLIKSTQLSVVPETAKWTKRVLDYNLSCSPKIGGPATVIAYEMLEKPENITEESLRQARIMGWCVEMMHVYLVILDDIMDESTTRRGMPCWHKIPEVGLEAINDAILICASLHHTLETYFSDRPQYSKILKDFNEALITATIGQHLDYTMAQRKKSDYSLFTIDRYNHIATYKAGYVTFKLPVSLGLYLANRTDKETHQRVESVVLDLGRYYQIQDDYIDCFGNELITGNRGTDIQEGKCSWLAVTALERCNPQQRALFEEYYGSRDPAHVQQIKQLYKELQLPQLYREFEQVCYDRIVENAKVVPESVGSNFSDLITRLIYLFHKKQQN